VEVGKLLNGCKSPGAKLAIALAAFSGLQLGQVRGLTDGTPSSPFTEGAVQLIHLILLCLMQRVKPRSERQDGTETAPKLSPSFTTMASTGCLSPRSL
jgi:hypothetical protein